LNPVADFAVLASRRMIFDLPVCDLDWEDALTFIDELASLPVGHTAISFVNAHNMLVMLRDESYREVLERNLVLPDGVGLDIASRVAHGEPFPANLNGTDFVPALLTFMERPKRIGLVGGRRAIVEKAAERMRQHAPWHEFIVISDGFFDPARSDAVTREISREVHNSKDGQVPADKANRKRIDHCHSRQNELFTDCNMKSLRFRA